MGAIRDWPEEADGEKLAVVTLDRGNYRVGLVDLKKGGMQILSKGRKRQRHGRQGGGGETDNGLHEATISRCCWRRTALSEWGEL